MTTPALPLNAHSLFKESLALAPHPDAAQAPTQARERVGLENSWTRLNEAKFILSTHRRTPQGSITPGDLPGAAETMAGP